MEKNKDLEKKSKKIKEMFKNKQKNIREEKIQ